MTHETSIRASLVLLTAALLAGCDGPGTATGSRAAEPAPQGALPDIEGALIGPQPGPDRAVPQVENPYGMEPGVLAEGRRLFVWYNCYGCHGGRAGGGMGPSLRDAAWLYGSSHRAIFNSIAEGRSKGMPGWGTKLPEQQIWKITAYIKSLNTAAEPKRPPANPVVPNPPARREGARAGGGA